MNKAFPSFYGGANDQLEITVMWMITPWTASAVSTVVPRFQEKEGMTRPPNITAEVKGY